MGIQHTAEREIDSRRDSFRREIKAVEAKEELVYREFGGTGDPGELQLAAS